MTHFIVKPFKFVVQWAHEYGQAHPKMQGIFWIVMSVVFMIVPNLIGRSLTETMGRNVASCISLLIVIPFVFALQKEDARKITSRNLLLMTLGGVSAATVFSLFMGNIEINGDPASIPWFYYIVVVLYNSVLDPLYEEKLCRSLQLRGIQVIAGSLAAILLTSAIFGLAHKGNEMAMTVYAVILACMALYFRIGAIERAVAHGAYNFALDLHVSFLLLPA